MKDYENNPLWKKYGEYKKRLRRIETNRKVGRPDDYDGPYTMGERWQLDSFGSGFTWYSKEGDVTHPNGVVTKAELHHSLHEFMALKFEGYTVKAKSFMFCECGIQEEQRHDPGRFFKHKLRADWFDYRNKLYLDSELIEIRWDKCDKAKIVIWDFDHYTVQQIVQKVFLLGRKEGELTPAGDTDEDFAAYDLERERILAEVDEIAEKIALYRLTK